MSTKTEKYNPKLDSFWTVNTSTHWMKPNWKRYPIKSSDPYSLDTILQYSEKQAREAQSSAWGIMQSLSQVHFKDRLLKDKPLCLNSLLEEIRPYNIPFSLLIKFRF